MSDFNENKHNADFSFRANGQYRDRTACQACCDGATFKTRFEMGTISSGEHAFKCNNCNNVIVFVKREAKAGSKSQKNAIARVEKLLNGYVRDGDENVDITIKELEYGGNVSVVLESPDETNFWNSIYAHVIIGARGAIEIGQARQGTFGMEKHVAHMLDAKLLMPSTAQ